MSQALHIPRSSHLLDKLVLILKKVESQMTDSDSVSGLAETLSALHTTFSPDDYVNHFGEVPRMLDAIESSVVNQFLGTSFPCMCSDILRFVESRDSIESLRSQIPCTVSFDAIEVYILVSMSFLGIPLVRAERRTTLKDGTCVYMFSNRPKQVAKLTCLLNYFNVIVAAKQGFFPSNVSDLILRRRISVERIVAEKTHGGEWWLHECNNPLSKVEYMPKFHRIETAHHAIQADFANKHIGGGVLRTGCVQEEIRFIISPETLISVFLCDPLDDNEALIIRNTVQISSYTGYSQSFKCTGFSKGLLEIFSESNNTLPTDDILCIDATPYTSEEQRRRQFGVHAIIRELEKCRCGLSGTMGKPFATGNWGCGVFGGDSQLKAVIQWLAASACSVDLLYFPFDDMSTADLSRLHEACKSLTVSHVARCLFECLAEEANHNRLIPAMIERMQISNPDHAT